MSALLLDALDRILRWVESHQPYYLDFLQPGLTQTEIEALAADLPFKLPPEVCQLYQWRNGATAGDLGQETAWLFANWTFVPLEEAIAAYHCSVTEIGRFTEPCKLIFRPFAQYRRLNLFYMAGIGNYGYLWLDREAKFFPVTLENFQEGSLSIYIKYSSLTNWMLTLAECYETATYTSEGTWYCFIDCECPERERQIWQTYNSDLIDWVISILRATPLCGLFFVYFTYELKEFKDERIAILLIEKLQEFLKRKGREPKPSFGAFSYAQKVESFNWWDSLNGYQPEKEAVEILGELGNPEAVPIILTVLDWDDFDDRWDVPRSVSAARALGELQDERATEPLIAMLSHRYSQVRESVIWALGRIQDPRAMESLIAARRDRDFGVRIAAQIAIRQLIFKHPESKRDIEIL